MLFGVIVVLTFTGSITVEGHVTDTRAVLIGAVTCNLAWGIVDAAMYLMASFTERARGLATLRAISRSHDRDAAHRLILNALPPLIANALTPVDVEALRGRLVAQHPERKSMLLTPGDIGGGAGVCLLVFLSTFPVVIPFFVTHDIGAALHASNGIALVMLFITGWSLGRSVERPGWRAGLGMVAVGIVLVAITNALGG